MFRGFMNKLRLGVTIVVAMFIIAGICGVLGVDTFRGASILERIMYFVFGLVGIGVMYIIIYYWFGKDNRCPSCHKPFCLKKTGE